MPEHPVLDAAQRFRAQALAREREAANRLVQTYGRAYTRFGESIQTLSSVIAKLESPDRADVVRLSALRSLRNQVEAEITRFAVYADQEVGRAATAAIQAGLSDSRALAAAAMGGTGPGARALISGWDMLPTESVETMLGFLADDSPLHSALVKRLGPAVAERMSDALVDGIVLGMNPRKVAEIVRKELGVGLTWALTTARTAQLNAYREASRANYVANSHIIGGWTWLSALGSGNTCMSCLNMHGSIHPVTEALNDHHNGRCLLPGQLVITARGEVPVEQVTIGDWVLTHKGRYQKVTATSETPYSGDIYTIEQNGYSVSVTSEHPVLTENRGWVAARDCTAFDTFSTLCDALARASNLSTVHPQDFRHESLFWSNAFFPLALCQPTSNSTSNLRVGKAKSALYGPIAYWGMQRSPESQIALSRVNSPSVENDSQFFIRVWANALARLSVASGVLIRDSASGLSAIWRKAASLDEMGSILLSFIQRISVRVLIPSSAQMSRYEAFSPMYLLASQSAIDSPILFSISASKAAEMSFPKWDISLFNPSVLARCNTALWVLPGKRLAMSLWSIVSKLSTMILSSNSDHAFRAISDLVSGSVDNGTIIHHPTGKVKLSLYSGMVYNLQVDEDESYIAGGIVVHNCVAIPNVKQAKAFGLPQPDIEPGQQWFERQPEAFQRERMGPGMFDAWKAGKFDFRDLSVPYQDAVYGEMLREATLKGLLTGKAKGKTLTFGTPKPAPETVYYNQNEIRNFVGRDGKQQDNSWTIGKIGDTNLVYRDMSFTGKPPTAALLEKYKEQSVNIVEAGLKQIPKSDSGRVKNVFVQELKGPKGLGGEAASVSGDNMFISSYDGKFDIGPGGIVHEMGHVVNNTITQEQGAAWLRATGWDGDYTDPLKVFREATPNNHEWYKYKAVTEYGTVHPGESFAEAYRLAYAPDMNVWASGGDWDKYEDQIPILTDLIRSFAK